MSSHDSSPTVWVSRVGDDDADLAELLRRTVAELTARYPTYHPEPFVDDAEYFVARLDGRPVGCIALVVHDDLPGVGEVKRLYVDDTARRAGVAQALMSSLEARAGARGLTRIVLETGNRQPEAVALYERLGYAVVDPYHPQGWNEVSIFMARDLAPTQE
ncbi:GNAT family N-acetyltransferase [uncultured Williamsia sp.]|uniref:GNAT family N-acetyltransferase n=1 Tax=uncultured Williamsia sp. TaxID=259311 RepID=UPI002618FF87|nr:GNAT family N-acetyltransferase [uncultured Williamsia sp.]